MSQNDFNLANQGFPAMRADMNSAFQALASNSSGATEPGTTYAYQWWYDETTDILKMRNSDNDAWINIASFDQTNDTWTPYVGSDLTIPDKITHTGDTDTSIRFPAADTVTVETAGAERVKIDSSGNVGIGTSDTSGFKLDVAGTARANSLTFRVNGSTPSGDASVFRPSNSTLAFATNSTERMRIDSSGNVGIGTSSPAYMLDVSGVIATQGAYFTAITPADVGSLTSTITSRSNAGANNAALVAYHATSTSGRSIAAFFSNVGSTETKVAEINTQGGAYFAGNVGIGTSSPSATLDVNGSLSKSSGSFKIDHPIKPDTHHLVHSFIEGPQADNIYRGKVALVDGTSTVNLDEAGRMTEGTFVALNGNVQCFTTNEDGWTAVRGAVDGNILTIEAQDAACTDTVSWLVIGERHDQHMIDANWTDGQGRIITEPAKGTAS